MVIHFTVSREIIRRGELAKRSGCNIETIRYYENIGLLPLPARNKGGHRLYAQADQERLRFLMRCRELGFSIDELRSLLSLVDSGEYSCGEVHELTMNHLKGVRKKMADLRMLEKTLKTIAANCAGGSKPDCPIIDALKSD